MHDFVDFLRRVFEIDACSSSSFLLYSNFFRITNNKHAYMSFALSQHTSFAPKSPGIFTRIWASLYTHIPIPVYSKIVFSIFWSDKSIFLYIACIWVLLFYRIWAFLNLHVFLTKMSFAHSQTILYIVFLRDFYKLENT